MITNEYIPYCVRFWNMHPNFNRNAWVEKYQRCGVYALLDKLCNNCKELLK